MKTTNWPEFYFARHGETDWNREKRYQGSRDIPLNDKGQKQADANGVLLRFLLEEAEIDPASLYWYASPLSRARETMLRMRAAFSSKLPDVIYDQRLAEISFGELEGKLHADLPENMAIRPGSRNAQYWDYRPVDGENYVDLAARLNEFAQEMRGPAIVVSHGAVHRALRHIVEGVERVEAINWPPPQGAIAHFTPGKMALHIAPKTWVD